MKLDLLEGTYVIVGGGSGMGLAAATAIARSGGRVAIIGRDEARVRATAESLSDECSVQVHAFCGDVAQPSEVATQLIAKVVDDIGPIAGVAVTTGTPVAAHRSLLDATDDDWDVAFQEVLMGTVRVAKAVIPAMIASGGGALVTTSAYSIRDPSGHRTPYTVTKGALPVLTKDIARRFGENGIRANCVCPGIIATKAAQERGLQMHRAWGDDVDSFDDVVKKTPMSIAANRAGQPREVGEVIAFLLSKNSSYLSGATINIDGGTIF